MDTALSLLNLVCAAFTFGMVILMLVTFRKPRTIGRFAPLLSALLSLLLLGLFWLLSGAHLNGLVAVPAFGLGLALGGLIGLTARLYPQGDRVMGRHSWLFLLGWGASLVLAQLLLWTGWPLAASLGLIPLVFGTGTNVGRELSLFVRRWGMAPSAA
jgi:hypothetical protein